MDEVTGTDIRAVVVGLSSYQGQKDLPATWQLPGAVPDALRFTTWLRGCGVPSENIALWLSPLDQDHEDIEAYSTICGAQPNTASSRDQLMDAFTKHLGDGTGTQLIVYWGGHGMTGSDGHRLLLCPDASTRDKRCIDLEDLQGHLREDDPFGRFRRQVFLIDTCATYFEGHNDPSGPALARFPPPVRRRPTAQFSLYATAPGHATTDRQVARTGQFSHRLLTYLKEQSPDQLPDWRETAEHMKQHFMKDSAEGSLPAPVVFDSQTFDGDRHRLTFPLAPHDGRPGRLGEKLFEAKLNGPVTSLCFGPDATLLAAASAGPVRHWRYHSGEELSPLRPRGWWGPRYGTRVAASEAGGPIVLRDGFTVRVQQTQEATVLAGSEVGSVVPPGYLEPTSNAKYVLTSWATRYQLLSVARRAVVGNFGGVAASALSADGRTLALAKGLVQGGGVIRAYRLEPGQNPEMRELRPVKVSQVPGTALQIALSSDGSLLGCVTSLWQGVFDVGTGGPVMPRATGSELGAQVMPDAMGLVCTPRGRLLWLSKGTAWQLRGNKRDDEPILPRGHFRRLVLSVDGSTLAAGDSKGWVRVWRWKD